MHVHCRGCLDFDHQRSMAPGRRVGGEVGQAEVQVAWGRGPGHVSWGGAVDRGQTGRDPGEEASCPVGGGGIHQWRGGEGKPSGLDFKQTQKGSESQGQEGLIRLWPTNIYIYIY